MNWYKKMYVFALNAKLTMGVFYVAIVFVTAVITLCLGGTGVSAWSLLSMLLAAMLIGFSQELLLGNADFSGSVFFGRSILWVVFSMAVTLGGALIFRWFAALPAWSVAVLGAVMLFGFIAMLVSQKFEWEADAIGLNRDLRQYQNDVHEQQ
ncbi:MAG: hypothetical protein VB092_08520 [Oscillospiraceae bacterium]|nr:hypothetical protein [Oscillospiraceae bacterium]